MAKNTTATMTTSTAIIPNLTSTPTPSSGAGSVAAFVPAASLTTVKGSNGPFVIPNTTLGSTTGSTQSTYTRIGEGRAAA
eukprot:CAMPEP_0175072102 /NCGR_PEP_ID=MMETSP0052_2-20121109/19684_1 /TAXON_ID=51329 ORGANISM="Polytomella parva, Strain SAG 63-3" /NCGR_SAMPLE_ID=MMETSP0052_2 /ASSEMBLY_ACC=CAM_ASM_000194 /LENGTH=79 /DNA_ID=CAMNT_0016339491 /DNA_START=91 /DNA_END=326 /DNA_ORIENTATION=-